MDGGVTRVLFLQGSSGFGGSKVCMLNTFDALAGTGIVPVVACPERGWLTTELERRGVEYALVPFFAWRKWLDRPRVGITVRRRWVPAFARWKVALVDSNEFWWAPHAVLTGRALGVPVVVHLRDGLHTLRKARQYRLGQADRVVAVSTELREHFAADPDLYARTVMLHDAHEEYAASDPALRRACRDELGLGPGDFAVGNAGRLCERKNQRLLLAALGDLGRRGALAGVKAVLIGGADPAYEEALRQDAARLGLQGAVVFAGWRPDLRRFFVAMDLLAHCATREGLARVIPEAMLARCPVVATPSEGVRDAIPDDGHGTVVPHGDAPALARAIEAMAADPARRAAVAAAAHARARRLFTLDAHRTGTLALYRSLGVVGSAAREAS
jgi:glycosyltransferase involved in cell wall biosynthesis